MRISCKFRCNHLPVGYNMIFVGLIKEAIKSQSIELYRKLYEFQGKSNKSSKNFCFSVGFDEFQLSNNQLIINGYTYMNVSSPDYELMINLYNGLNQMKKHGDRSIILEKVYLLPEQQIFEEQVILRTMSPILIQTKEGKHLMPTDAAYDENLNYITNIILRNFRGVGLKKPLSIRYINEYKKVIVKQPIRNFIENTGKEYMFINAHKGVFELKGDVIDLNHIYQSGLGYRRNQGFGMLER